MLGRYAPWTKLPAGPFVREVLRFTAVGVIGTGVHYGVLIGLVEVAHASPVLGTFVGFLVAAFVSYTLNRRYTFAIKPAFSAGLVRNYLALAVGLGINVGTVALLTHLGLVYILAQIVATVIAFIWNYLASRFVVFRTRRPMPVPGLTRTSFVAGSRSPHCARRW